MSKKRLLAFKLILTLMVCIAFALPFFFSSLESGFLRDFRLLGVTGSVISISVFLILVFFYCQDLQKTLELVHPENRTANPKSVWFMFFIPYNFIEDFFIIYHVSKSIEQESELVKHNGLTLGLGWCIAQILSILPGSMGLISAIFAIVLWLGHWYFIKRTIKRFAEKYEKNDR